MSTEPAPTPSTYGGELGQPPVFDVDVAEGTQLADETVLESASNEDEDPGGDEQAPVPGTGVAAMLAALAGLARVRGRGASGAVGGKPGD